MRSSQLKLQIWPFAADRSSPPDDSSEAFDSYGPVSDIRRALSPAGPRKSMQSPHDHTRILLAEDDPFHRRVLRVLLGSPRISMIEVEDGQSAVDLLALRSFDLLLLDLTLPQMTGEDVIRWIRRSHTPWADIPILGMVDEQHRPEVDRLRSLGMTDWTAKPLDRRDLAESVVRLMPGLFDAGL